MLFEALQHLRLETRTLGVLQLFPGERVDLPSKAVYQLLAQAPTKIRILHEGEDKLRTPEPGLWAIIRSPLFGLCTARIREAQTNQIVITDHSVIGTEEGIKIPAHWIINVFKDQDETT